MPIEFDPSFWNDTWTFRRGVQGQVKAAILAAGLGRRMDPLTVRHLPKPLFPLGGKVPMTEVWVRRMVESGITDISMNLCVLSDTIRRHFRNGARFAARISFVEERTPSGTFGGVCKQILGERARAVGEDDQSDRPPEFAGSTVIVPSGDIVTNFSAELLEEMYDIHRSVGAALTVVLVPVPWERRADYGTVVLDSPEQRSGMISKSARIREFREKDPDSPSNLNNASIYMIEKELLQELDPLRTEARLGLDRPFYDFGKHVFPAMLGNHPSVQLDRDYPLWGIQYDGKWFDVGQKRDYIRVNEYLLDGELDISLPYQKLVWGYLGNNVSIDFDRVTIRPPVVLGNDCVVERGAVLGPYAVIGDGWVVETGACVRHSVLWQRYPFFDDEGNEIPVQERRMVDRHEIRKGVTVEGSIVVGGAISRDVRHQTVDLEEDGRLTILPIDHVPQEARP